MRESFIDVLQEFFGSEYEVLCADEYEIEIKNNSGKVVSITSEGGLGYNAGLSWLRIETNCPPNPSLHDDRKQHGA